MSSDNRYKNGRYITINNETHSIAEWARIVEINKSTMCDRVNANLPPEELLKKNRRVNCGKKEI